jgi:hypothetical protein
MRVFERVNSKRVASNDGVSVYSVARHTMRYERPEKYCDVYRDAFFRNGEVAGSALSLKSTWMFTNGKDAPMTDADMKEIKRDLIAAYKAFGSEIYFEGNLENVEID